MTDSKKTTEIGKGDGPNNCDDQVKEKSGEEDVAKIVSDRAAALMSPGDSIELDKQFIKGCLDSNERGDGVMFAELYNKTFLYNKTPDKGQWFWWNEHVWEKDTYDRSVDAVEKCALWYLNNAAELQEEIEAEGIEDKNHPDYWKVGLLKKYKGRIDRLRSKAGVNNALHFSMKVDRSMACVEEDLNTHAFLLPVKNGVIDLRTGALTNGRPADRMTRALDLEYDPHADYTDWHNFLVEVSGCEKVAAFLKRSFGHAITGDTTEQMIWVFIGPGRNGKGVLFGIMAKILGQFYHQIDSAMLLEQRNPPSVNAATEHLHSLLGKRLIVGAETNKNDKISEKAVKGLTGDDPVKCRPNFSGEITFDPTHKIFLHTQYTPYGLTSDFALTERLLLVTFPFRYVDDIEASKKKYPGHADSFRQKDKGLKEKFMNMLPGILRWLVEGCREWQEVGGLAPPQSIQDAVTKLTEESDYVGTFITDVLEYRKKEKTLRLPCKAMYKAFKWWWNENMDMKDIRMPAMKTINKSIRDRGIRVEKVGGKTFIYSMRIKLDVAMDIETTSDLG